MEDLIEIVALEDSIDKGARLLEYATFKASNHMEDATDTEVAVASIYAAALGAKGGNWSEVLSHDPNSKYWNGFIRALELLKHHEYIPLFKAANDILWDPDADGIDWDDPPISVLRPIDEVLADDQSVELDRLRRDTEDFLAELAYDLYDFAISQQEKFTPIPKAEQDAFRKSIEKQTGSDSKE